MGLSICPVNAGSQYPGFDPLVSEYTIFIPSGSGAWNVPTEGVDTIRVLGRAPGSGGGSSGGHGGGNPTGGGGGGGGGAFERTYTDLNGGEAFQYKIGGPGAGGADAPPTGLGYPGQNGGNTAWDSLAAHGPACTATAGTGGSPGPLYLNQGGGQPGVATGGQTNWPGLGGGGSQSGKYGGWGGGGQGPNAGSNTGTNNGQGPSGRAYSGGGGGGGAETGGWPGGNGASGGIWITVNPGVP